MYHRQHPIPSSVYEDRFSSLGSSGVLRRGFMGEGVHLVDTGARDRLGRALLRRVSLDPETGDIAGPEFVTTRGTDVRMVPYRHPQGRVGQGTEHSRGARHSVGHGHGGGGHGGHPHGHPFGPFGWGGWLEAGYPVFEIPCPDGWAELPDGTCVEVSGLDTHHATIGACCGSCVPDMLVGQATQVPLTPGGAGGDNQGTFQNQGNGSLGPAAGASGTQTSGNPQADALNLQWAALQSFVQECQPAASNLALPAKYGTDTGWSQDLAGWQNYYAGIGSFGTEDLTGSLYGWQDYANAWGEYLKSLCPHKKLPDNYPTGKPYEALPGLSGLENALNQAGTVLGWTVVAVAVAAGVWLLWPVLHAAL